MRLQQQIAALLRQLLQNLAVRPPLIDERGAIHPYPRPLRLRTEEGRIRRRIAQPQRDALPLAAVVLTEFAAGAHWSPRPASHVDALLGVLANTVAARDNPRRVFDIVRRAVRGATVLAGPRGEAAETAHVLLHAVRRRGAA